MSDHRRLRVVVAIGVVLAVLAAWSAWPDQDGEPAAREPTTTTEPRPSSTGSTATSTSTSTTAPTTTASSTTVVPTTAPPRTTITTVAPPPPPTTEPPPPTTTPTTVPPVPGSDRSVYVLGDSALLGAKDTVPAALAGWVVTFDAVGSRRLVQGIEVLRANRAQIGAVAVIQLGNNYIEGEGGSFASQIDQAMTVLTGVPRVVWLTVAERWPSRVIINQAIRATPSRWPNAVVGDWAAQIAAHPEYAYDQLHLTPAGRTAIAQLIASLVGPPPP